MLGLTLVVTANGWLIRNITQKTPIWLLNPAAWNVSTLLSTIWRRMVLSDIFSNHFFCFLLWDKKIPENVTSGLKIWHRRHIVVTLHCTVKTQTENKHICFHFRREVVSKQAVMLCLQQTWLLVGRDRWKKNLHLKLRSNFDCALYKATVWSFLSC